MLALGVVAAFIVGHVIKAFSVEHALKAPLVPCVELRILRLLPVLFLNGSRCFRLAFRPQLRPKAARGQLHGLCQHVARRLPLLPLVDERQ